LSRCSTHPARPVAGPNLSTGRLESLQQSASAALMPYDPLWPPSRLLDVQGAEGLVLNGFNLGRGVVVCLQHACACETHVRGAKRMEEAIWEMLGVEEEG